MFFLEREVSSLLFTLILKQILHYNVIKLSIIIIACEIFGKFNSEVDSFYDC